MKNMKPVWRLNTGKGVPSAFGGKTYVPDSLLSIRERSDYKYKDRLWVKTGVYDIYAYQTTRTREAKR
jgi:hypothetical protein